MDDIPHPFVLVLCAAVVVGALIYLDLIGVVGLLYLILLTLLAAFAEYIAA